MRDKVHFCRIDILAIKSRIGKKLGSQKAAKYFNLLHRFFSRKLGKSEFDRLCNIILGRDNISLHNYLIRSILTNARLAKLPPSRGTLDKLGNEYSRSCLQSLCRDVIPPSPRRGRTPTFRNRKCRDWPSPLGPQGKPQAVACVDLGHVPHNNAQEQQSATELLSLGSKPPDDNFLEDGEEVDQAALTQGIHSSSPVSVTAPLGIAFNVKGNRKSIGALSSSTSHTGSCLGNGELPDTTCLKRRLEPQMEKEGLQVSLDCVNLLNTSLDVYLKRLIKLPLELSGSRKQTQESVLVVPGLSHIWPVRCIKRPGHLVSTSMSDFQTSVGLNPKILGNEWPLQLERICLPYI